MGSPQLVGLLSINPRFSLDETPIKPRSSRKKIIVIRNTSYIDNCDLIYSDLKEKIFMLMSDEE